MQQWYREKSSTKKSKSTSRCVCEAMMSAATRPRRLGVAERGLVLMSRVTRGRFVDDVASLSGEVVMGRKSKVASINHERL